MRLEHGVDCPRPFKFSRGPGLFVKASKLFVSSSLVSGAGVLYNASSLLNKVFELDWTHGARANGRGLPKQLRVRKMILKSVYIFSRRLLR
jgi:hypothetical protein